MPLRDHFRPPVTNRIPWEGFHGGWPMVIVQHLRKVLPAEYFAVPKVHLGPYFEIDIGTFELNDPPQTGFNTGNGTALWTAPSPTTTIELDMPDIDEYEVKIYSQTDEKQLVAAIELVSPSNKDRFESRQAFISKCATLLRQGVCVTIIDMVTVRQSNLFTELLEFIGVRQRVMSDPPPSLYAVTCRWLEVKRKGSFEAWAYPLVIGETLPTLPLWLSLTLPILFDFEQSYEATCTDLGLV